MIIRDLFLIGLVLMLSCGDRVLDSHPIAALSPQVKKVFKAGIVSVDNQFKGARLSGFKKLSPETFQILVQPENIPTNNSPWYSFRIWSEEPIDIRLEISYSDSYKHRYVPKISSDGQIWTPIQPQSYELDSIRGTIVFELNVTPKKLWVSAQENLSSDDINVWMDSLVDKKSYISRQRVGSSMRGQPIKLLRIKEKSPDHALVIVGRQHPPEVPGGTISMISFVQTVLSETQLANNFRDKFEILVFPLLNPDGVDDGHWRHNANGVDLNRDWISFSQPETQAVRDYLLQSKKDALVGDFRFGIDFHTSFSGPYLLTLDTIPHNVKPTITNRWIDKIEEETNQELDIRPRPQNLPYCYNWFINEIGMEAVTYEEGDEISRDVIRNRARDYANALMKILLDEYN